MSGNLQICSLSDDLRDSLKEFRTQKSANTSAMIIKVLKDSQSLVLEKEMRDCTVDNIKAVLPDNLPRFVIVSYKLTHSDGRVSYPLCLIYLSPQGCNPEVQMMYAGTKKVLLEASGVSKDFELRDVEDLTNSLLLEKFGVK